MQGEGRQSYDIELLLLPCRTPSVGSDAEEEDGGEDCEERSFGDAESVLKVGVGTMRTSVQMHLPAARLARYDSSSGARCIEVASMELVPDPFSDQGQERYSMRTCLSPLLKLRTELEDVALTFGSVRLLVGECVRPRAKPRRLSSIEGIRIPRCVLFEECGKRD